MSRTCFKRLRLPTISVWLTTTLMISAFGQHIVIAQPSATPDNSSSPNELAPEAKLRGQWQTKNPLSGKVLTFIFAPEGKLYIQLPTTSKPTAQEFGYRIKAAQPMQLDILFPGTDQVVKTIFEFTPTGEMRLQIAGTNPGDPRPSGFRPDATLLQKVSEVTTLPPDVEVQTIQMQLLQAQQKEGKIILASMNRAQQAYHLENNKFATTISELGLGIKPETDNYRYQIIAQKDSTGSVMMTATAKRSELRSYTGAVFAVKTQDNQDTLTIAGICETDKPSTTPPAMPKTPSDAEAKIECPAGSNLVGR